MRNLSSEEGSGRSYTMRAWIGLLFLSVVSACAESPDELAVREFRARHIVSTEPADAQTLTEVAERLSSDPAATTPIPAVVIGRIYAGELDPWEANQATFVLSELPAEGHGEGHDADNCPFCKRRAAKAPSAIVRFVNPQGETLAVDARKLLGAEKGQAVVIEGTVAAGALNSLLITADKIYLR